MLFFQTMLFFFQLSYQHYVQAAAQSNSFKRSSSYMRALGMQVELSEKGSPELSSVSAEMSSMSEQSAALQLPQEGETGEKDIAQGSGMLSLPDAQEKLNWEHIETYSPSQMMHLLNVTNEMKREQLIAVKLYLERKGPTGQERAEFKEFLATQEKGLLNWEYIKAVRAYQVQRCCLPEGDVCGLDICCPLCLPDERIVTLNSGEERSVSPCACCADTYSNWFRNLVCSPFRFLCCIPAVWGYNCCSFCCCPKP